MDRLRKHLQQRDFWREGAAYTPDTSGTAWLAPSSVEMIEVDGEPVLVWDLPRMVEDRQRISILDYYHPDDIRWDTAGMLNDFLALPNRGAKGVERFARRFGVLALCEHGFANSHMSTEDDPRPWACFPVQTESVACWMEWASRFRALAALAADLHRGGRGRNEDWAEAMENWDDEPTSDYEPSLYAGPNWMPRTEFAGAVQHLVLQARLRWQFEWNETGPAAVLTSEVQPNFSVVPLLVRELVYLISKTDGIVFCGSCGEPIISPARRPTATRKAYCEECRESGARLRIAQRKRRAKLKEGVA